MKKESLAVRIWDVLYPLLMYYAVIVITMFLTQGVFGTESKYYMIRQIIATLVAFPVVYVLFYRADVLLAKGFWRFSFRNLLSIIVIAACCGISLNNLLSMSPLIGMSEAFAKANEDFYAGPFLTQIIGSAILTPILEELIYRAVIYTRLKRHLGVIPAVFLSALIFGLMHFNIVQFVYAFVLGIMLALFMEKSGHVYGAIVGHMTVNTISVVRTETGILAGTVDGSAFAWVISSVILLAGAVLLYVYCRGVKRCGKCEK